MLYFLFVCSVVIVVTPNIVPDEPIQPCNPSPCGLNALCEERNRAAACKCIPEYFGDPYVECRPECVLNSDCSKSQACVNNKCVDPCPGVCGHNAECYALNHQANCECLLGFTGNPNVGCHAIPETPKCKQKTTKTKHPHTKKTYHKSLNTVAHGRSLSLTQSKQKAKNKILTPNQLISSKLKINLSPHPP